MPVADHHQHLFSPADVDLETPPLLPAISLPRDIQKLISEKERRWDNEAALALLYSDDAVVYNEGTSGWLRGAKVAARQAEWNISIYPYRIKPTRFSMNGPNASVFGYYTRPIADGSQRHFGFFHYDLVKLRSGQWRIASDTYIYRPVEFAKVRTAQDLVREMDAAGIGRAAVMSNAYYFDNVRLMPVEKPYPMVRAENDWTAGQLAQFPTRLFGFCSFNPLADYALDELRRCADSKKFTGLKLHFNAAQLKFHDASQVAKVRQVIAAANGLRLPMIIHARPGNQWGAAEADIFLSQLIAAAPDVPIQVAHLWGGETFSPSALKVFGDAIQGNDPRVRKLYFDISGTWSYTEPADMKEIVARMRQIGMSRLLYASDAPPAPSWEAFRKNVPLTEAEFRSIARNVAPYFTDSVP